MGQALSLDEIRAKFVAREKAVDLITDGGLLAEHERLTAELERATSMPADSLAGSATARELAEQVRALEERIAEATVTFRVRGLGRNQFRRLLAEHKGEGDDVFDPDTFPVALIAACSLDPVMTEEQAASLADVLTDGQWQELYDAAFGACREVDGVPFSLLASAVAPG